MQYLIFIYLVIPLTLFLVCLTNAINPRILWNIFQGWKATKEPPQIYFRIIRIISILVVVFILAWLVMYASSLLPFRSSNSFPSQYTQFDELN